MPGGVQMIVSLAWKREASLEFYVLFLLTIKASCMSLT